MRRTPTRLTLGLATALAATLFAGAARAVPVTWTLHNVSFVDGATASGSFTYDAATQVYTAWNITTTATVNPSAIGFTSLPGATYTTNGYTNASTSSYLNASSFGVRNLPGPGILQFGLVFAKPLTDAGGTVALKASSGGFESTPSGFASRPVVAGTGSVVSAVPEPASAVLMLAGVMGLAAWQRRRA
jgi:hypothetical protein